MDHFKDRANIPLGIGYYTPSEAARLLHTTARTINRWLGGYTYTNSKETHAVPPLWEPQLPRLDDRVHLGFRDLIELRFVQAFVNAGVNLRVIRACLTYARECINDPRPFSTSRFQTDGKTIFLDTFRLLEETNQSQRELLDLKRQQYSIATVLDRSFKDLDIDGDIVSRWRPLQGKSTIVLDPQRAFGQPITTEYGVPTVALVEAVEAEGSVERVSQLYEIPVKVIQDACKFEASLQAA